MGLVDLVLDQLAEEGQIMFERLSKEILFLSLTLGGTLLVLITLSGSTLQKGIYISAISLIAHLLGVAIDYWQDKNDNE